MIKLIAFIINCHLTSNISFKILIRMQNSFCRIFLKFMSAVLDGKVVQKRRIIMANIDSF